MATHETAGHDAHDAHVAPPPPPEPRTPMWLPALGALLFLSVGIWWLATPSEAAPPPADSSGAADGGSDAPLGLLELAPAGAHGMLAFGGGENARFRVVRGA